MKILALDFDGVLCDSAIECLINSYNSFNVIEESSIKKVYGLGEIATGEVKAFMTFRPLARVAKEYCLLWHMIKENQAIDPGKNINKQAKIPADKLEKFNSIFYTQRKEWMEKDIKAWLGHNPLYNGMRETLLKISDRENVFIVSSKDRSAIKAIMEYNELPVDEDKILGSDSGMDKDAVFHKLKEAYSISFSAITFLDDNVNNLLQAKDMGISVFFASWGYSMNTDKNRINEMCIPMVALENFGAWAVHIMGSTL